MTNTEQLKSSSETTNTNNDKIKDLIGKLDDPKQRNALVQSLEISKNQIKTEFDSVVKQMFDSSKYNETNKTVTINNTPLPQNKCIMILQTYYALYHKSQNETITIDGIITETNKKQLTKIVEEFYPTSDQENNIAKQKAQEIIDTMSNRPKNTNSSATTGTATEATTENTNSSATTGTATEATTENTNSPATTGTATEATTENTNSPANTGTATEATTGTAKGGTAEQVQEKENDTPDLSAFKDTFINADNRKRQRGDYLYPYGNDKPGKTKTKQVQQVCLELVHEDCKTIRGQTKFDDEMYGEKTRIAVKALQTKLNTVMNLSGESALVPDGAVGPKTVAVLKQYIESKNKPAVEGTETEEAQNANEEKKEGEKNTIEINGTAFTIDKSKLPSGITNTVEKLENNDNDIKITVGNQSRECCQDMTAIETKLITHGDKSYNITPEITDQKITFKVVEVEPNQAKKAMETKNNTNILDTQREAFESAMQAMVQKLESDETSTRAIQSILTKGGESIISKMDALQTKHYPDKKNNDGSLASLTNVLIALNKDGNDKKTVNDLYIDASDASKLSKDGNYLREVMVTLIDEMANIQTQIVTELYKNNKDGKYTVFITASNEITKSYTTIAGYLRTEQGCVELINHINDNPQALNQLLDTNKTTMQEAINNSPMRRIQNDLLTNTTNNITMRDNIKSANDIYVGLNTTNLNKAQESITTIAKTMKLYPLPGTNPPELFYFHPQQILDQGFAIKTGENISLIPNKDQLLREAINDKKLTAISVSSLVSKLYENPNIHIIPGKVDDRRDESDTDQRGFLEKFATGKVGTLDKKIGTLDPNQIGTELGKLGYNTKPNNINIIKDQPARTLTTSAIEKANQNLPIIKIKIGDTESFITKQDYNKLAGLDKNGKQDIGNKESKKVATKNGQEQTTLQIDAVQLFAQKYNISGDSIKPNGDGGIMIVPDTKEGNDKYNGATIYVDEDLKLYGDGINTTTNPIQCTSENLLTRIDAMKKISTAIRQSQDRVNDKKNKASDTQRGQLAFLQTYAKQLITGETLTTTTQPPAIAKKETYGLSADIDFTNKVNINDFTFIEIDKESNKEDKNKNFFTYTKKI